ncbi:MAG TPA: hypothetical protein PLX41_10520 [Bacteroidales bacterium]|nr:hypothetical protein [Bacteroidales bacterium]
MSLFYNISPKGTVSINNYSLGKYVQSLGFAKHYFTNEKTITPIYVYKDKNNIIEPVSPIRVHEVIIRELETRAGSSGSIPVEDLPRVVDKLVGSRILTSQELLITMDHLDKPIISDTSDTAVFPFRNGVATVTRDDIKFNPLSSIDGYIWSTQKTDRDFELGTIEDAERSDFFRFLGNITATGTTTGWAESQDRFNALYTLIGYLLHSYKDPTNPRAVILMDSSLVGEPTGRTGKGLIVQGLNKIRNTVKIDGKDYDGSNRFKFSGVSPDAKLIFLDDVGQGFDFENLFSIVTEGIKVEEKYVKSYYIPFDRSPKIIISTNYALHGRGASHDARKYEFALSNYYSDNRRPTDEFGRRFFYDWDTTQWNYFDNLMLYAVQAYLQNGVTNTSDPLINEKKLITETSLEFVEWISEQGLTINVPYVNNDLHERFNTQTGIVVDRKTFLRYLKSYCYANGWELLQPHSGNTRSVEFRRR